MFARPSAGFLFPHTTMASKQRNDSPTAQVAISATYTGPAFPSEANPTQNDGSALTVAETTYCYFNAAFLSDQVSAANGAQIQCAPLEAGPWTVQAQATLAVGVPTNLSAPVVDRFYRAVLVNSTTAATVSLKTSYTDA